MLQIKFVIYVLRNLASIIIIYLYAVVGDMHLVTTQLSDHGLDLCPLLKKKAIFIQVQDGKLPKIHLARFRNGENTPCMLQTGLAIYVLRKLANIIIIQLYLYTDVGDMHLVTWQLSDNGFVLLALRAALMTVLFFVYLERINKQEIICMREWCCLWQVRGILFFVVFSNYNR